MNAAFATDEDLELELLLKSFSSLTEIERPQPPVFRGNNLFAQTYRGREFLLSGPSDTGKTWAAVWLLDSLMRETPHAQGILARKLQVTIWGTVLVTYKKIQELRKALGDAPAEAYGGEKPEFYDYSNGARLWVGGMDNPNKMLSGERDFVYFNQAEELNLADWEILYTRCTGRGAVTKTPMLFGDCNPGPEDHWILKRPTLRLFPTMHKDNPSIYDDAGNLLPEAEGRIRDLQTLTGVRKKRLWEGQWVGVEGAFFETFDPEPGGEHVIDSFDVTRDMPIWGALDHGFAHNTAFGLFTAYDGDIILLGEHVKHKLLPAMHCKAIYRLLERLSIHPSRLKQVFAGHDVFAQRGDQRNDEDAKTIAERYAMAVDPETGDKIPLNLIKANIARVPGWNEILTLLGNKEQGVKARLKIVKTCTRTIQTMTRLVADPDDAEDVKKVDADMNGEGGDDSADMLRYGVTSRRKQSFGVLGQGIAKDGRQVR